MQLAPVIQRLQQNVPALKQVGGAMDLTALGNAALLSNPPAAFVIPLNDRACYISGSMNWVTQRRNHPQLRPWLI